MSVTADQIACAIVAAASVYGDDPTQWAGAAQTTMRRALSPAISAVCNFCDVPVPTVAAMLGVDPGAVMSARSRKRGMFASAERAALRALGKCLPPDPQPPTRVHKLIPKALAAREMVMAALGPLHARYPDGVSAKALMQATGLSYHEIVCACAWLDRHAMAAWRYRGDAKCKVLVPVGAKTIAPPRETHVPADPDQLPGYSEMQTRNMALVLEALRRMAGDAGHVTISYTQLSKASGVAAGSLGFLVYELQKRGLLIVGRGSEREPNTYTFPNVAVAPEPIAAPEAPIVRVPKPVEPPRPPAKPTFAPPIIADAAPFTAEDFELPDEPDSIGVGLRSLMQLKSRMCHWPVGEPSPVQLYCAATTGCGEQYCAEHARKMFVRSVPRKPRTAAQLAHDARLADQARQRFRDRRAGA